MMNAMRSQITGVSIIFSTVYSGVDQRKHQSTASQRATNAKNVSIDDVIMPCPVLTYYGMLIEF